MRCAGTTTRCDGLDVLQVSEGGSIGLRLEWQLAQLVRTLRQRGDVQSARNAPFPVARSAGSAFSRVATKPALKKSSIPRRLLQVIPAGIVEAASHVATLIILA